MRISDWSSDVCSSDLAVTTGESTEKLAEWLVADWTRLSPEQRAKTNILVLDNASRLIVNTKVRETLKTEGAIAAEEARLSILSPTGKIGRASCRESVFQ